MTARPCLPSGVAGVENDHRATWRRWEQAEFRPLEPLVETKVGAELVRLAAPHRRSWRHRNGRWEPLLGATARHALCERATRLVEARLLLTVRGAPEPTVATLAATGRPTPLTETAAWLGWPDLAAPNGASGPAHIRERLAARSNDYWPVDLAARTLGLGDLTGAPIRVPAWPPGISVVIPAHSVADVLPGVLAAVVDAAGALPPGTPWECLVVDDANEPPLRPPPGLPPHVRIIRSERQVFCGGARNLGLRHARYGLTAFCDADTHLAPGFLAEHCARHALTPNLITVSLREYVPRSAPVPARPPRLHRDTRVEAGYAPGRLGLVEVTHPVVVRPLAQTRGFRDFGRGRLLGPVDLPFMVKGNNLAIPTQLAQAIEFPPDFVGWGPEDVCFAAKCIARGAFVVPVLSTGVFHRDHPPRSGSGAQRDRELRANLARYAHHLATPAEGPWLPAPETQEVSA